MIGNIERKHERFAAGQLDFTFGGLEAVAPARDQANLGFAFAKCLRRGTADAGGCSSDDDHFG